MHQKNGEEEQKWMESIQKNSSFVQEKQPYFQRSQETSKTNNNIEGEWGHDRYNNPMGCSLLPVYDQDMFLKERSQETFSAPKPRAAVWDWRRYTASSNSTTATLTCKANSVKEPASTSICRWRKRTICDCPQTHVASRSLDQNIRREEA